MTEYKGNKGEWSEIYIFLKLLNDGKIAIADKNMNALKGVFLNIIKILRESYEYRTGKIVHILLNNKKIASVNIEEISKCQSQIFDMIQSKVKGQSIIATNEVANFLESIKVTKLTAPGFKSTEFFGGTSDLIMEVEDFRNGINALYGFSCKSSFSAEATLFNASSDNTNFIYEIKGNINDVVMNKFNNIVDSKGHTAIGNRIQFLKENNLDIEFSKMAVNTAERNLVLSGGKELPLIVANMLKFYYFENEGKSEKSSLPFALQYVVENNIADYPYEKSALPAIYERKIGTLLYDMFTGLRFSTLWSGKSSVSGGYIIAKDSGEVVAYHSMLSDEFKEFLINQLGFESPSASRHGYMRIEKIDNKYFLKLNLQIRFKKVKGNT